jgi:signal transduction histidine kinase
MSRSRKDKGEERKEPATASNTGFNDTSNRVLEGTRIIEGREEIKKLAFEEIKHAQRKWDAYGDRKLPISALTTEQMWQLTIEMIRRGVKVRCITEITRENISYCKQLSREAELRHLDNIKGGFTVIDDASCIIHPEIWKEEASAAIIYSTARPIIDQQQYVFETLWNKAIPAKEKIQEIEQGIEREIIETIKDPSEMQNLAFELINAAKCEILGIYSTSNAFRRQERIGNQELMLNAAKERGIRIRILSPFDDGILESIERLQCQSEGKIKIRSIDPDMQTKASLLLVDRKYALSVEVKDDTKETSIEAMGLAMYSNSDATVSSYVAIFESLWHQADMYERLRVHNERQREFLEIAAHELRTPIQPILGLSGILSEQSDERGNDSASSITRKQFLEIINRNANRLYKLTEILLDVARIENQTLQLNKENTDLIPIVKDAIADIEATKVNQRVRLSFISPLEGDQEVHVNVDRERITQVICNLLSNALRFTKEGVVHITLEKNILDERQQQFVTVSIRDSGLGIDPKILPRLFTKFASSSEKGMGLGLFISKGIVEAHRGEIWAENNYHDENDKDNLGRSSKGATFSFTLPIL